MGNCCAIVEDEEPDIALHSRSGLYYDRNRPDVLYDKDTGAEFTREEVNQMLTEKEVSPNATDVAIELETSPAYLPPRDDKHVPCPPDDAGHIRHKPVPSPPPNKVAKQLGKDMKKFEDLLHRDLDDLEKTQLLVEKGNQNMEEMLRIARNNNRMPAPPPRDTDSLLSLGSTMPTGVIKKLDDHVIELKQVLEKGLEKVQSNEKAMDEKVNRVLKMVEPHPEDQSSTMRSRKRIESPCETPARSSDEVLGREPIDDETWSVSVAEEPATNGVCSHAMSPQTPRGLQHPCVCGSPPEGAQGMLSSRFRQATATKAYRFAWLPVLIPPSTGGHSGQCPKHGHFQLQSKVTVQANGKICHHR